MIYPIISLILLLAGFAFGIKYDEDKDIAMLEQQPIDTKWLWIAVACFILSFIVFYGGAK